MIKLFPNQITASNSPTKAAGTSGTTPTKKGKPKAKPKDRFIPPGTSEGDLLTRMKKEHLKWLAARNQGRRFAKPQAGKVNPVVQQLFDSVKLDSSLERRTLILSLYENHWSDSPEFTKAFLFAASCCPLNPELEEAMKKGILHLLPKDKDPSQMQKKPPMVVNFAITHILVEGTLRFKRGQEWRARFIQELIEQRPHYKDYLLQRLR